MTPENRFTTAVFSAALLLILAAACARVPARPQPPLTTTPNVDLARYQGTWHEIARYPHWFEEGCFGATAHYEQQENREIRVINRCRKGGPEGTPDEATGRARVVPESGNAKLKVSFFWPFEGDYWIIHLDENYRHAIVSEPNRQYLWILSRDPEMDAATLAALKEKIRQMGFDLAPLTLTPRAAP